MTVKELQAALSLTAFSAAEPDREIHGGYTGDLLSWVMGRAEADQAWITIMSNQNIVAVATLTDVAVIILAEDVQPDAGVAETAMQRGINLYGSSLSSYELSVRLGALLQ